MKLKQNSNFILSRNRELLAVVFKQRLEPRIGQYRNEWVMRLLTSILIFSCTICSCKKKQDLVKTFIGDLPIVSTNSPATVIAGQNIVANVHCGLTSISGAVYFQGFDISAVNTWKFNITAKAFYKDWNTQIGMPVMWTLDTSVNIQTTVAGEYVLNFYNSAQLVASDTVDVN